MCFISLLLSVTWCAARALSMSRADILLEIFFRLNIHQFTSTQFTNKRTKIPLLRFIQSLFAAVAGSCSLLYALRCAHYHGIIFSLLSLSIRCHSTVRIHKYTYLNVKRARINYATPAIAAKRSAFAARWLFRRNSFNSINITIKRLSGKSMRSNWTSALNWFHSIELFHTFFCRYRCYCRCCCCVSTVSSAKSKI